MKSHGHGYENRLYRIWKGMRTRCNNPNSKDYKNYGGRGIKVCEEWEDFIIFRTWSLENGYSDKLTIDRIDGEDGYSPGNCRWSNLLTQNRNRRCTTVQIDGETLSLREVSEKFNIKLTTIRNRYYNQGYRDEELISPSHQGRKIS